MLRTCNVSRFFLLPFLHKFTFKCAQSRGLQLLNLQHFPGRSNWHLANIRYHVHSDYGMESYMLFEADSTSASSLQTDSGTLDMHLWRNEKGKLPLIFPY